MDQATPATAATPPNTISVSGNGRAVLLQARTADDAATWLALLQAATG